VNWHEWRDAPSCDFAVLGDPIHHSRSPQMHQAAFRALELDLTYRAIRVPLDEFAPALDHLASLGIKGVNCTLPLKGAARAWAAARGGLTGESRGCLPGPWSANTLNLLTQEGISTDEGGFLALLRSLAPEGKPKILLLGAGGTGQALVHRLIQEEWEVAVWNRTPGKWEALLGEETSRTAVLAEISLKGVGILVNATSSGLVGDPLAIPWEEAEGRLTAFDLLYGRETEFLKSARERGIPCADGAVMLMEQGALSFEWWLDRAAPRSAMLEAIHADPSAH